MAHIFLSKLKTTLNDCIDELDEIHFMFCKNLDLGQDLGHKPILFKFSTCSSIVIGG